MQRYRAFGPNDDTPMVEGDDSFVGINEYDTPENLQPGQVQAAVNCDFTSQDGITRGGFVCLPELGGTAFGSWTSRTSAENNAWIGLTYGNGTYVAVSEAGANQVMTSTDGLNWIARTAAAALTWNSVAYGGGVFVAVASSGAGNRVMTSSDGATWTLQTSSDDNDWRSVTYGNGLFVAVADAGNGYRVMTSPNGVTWTSRLAGTSAWKSVTYGNGTFVAVANAGSGDRTMYSTDGTSWATAPAAAAYQWSGVTYGAGLFVAVATSGGTSNVMTSPTGEVWTTRTGAVDNQFQSVAFGNSVFVAVASTGTLDRSMESSDGITWRKRTTPVDNFWRAVTFGNGLFVATSSSGTGDRVMTTSGRTVYASGVYSDPDDAGSQWTMLAGESSVGFYAFGRQSRTVSYASGQTVSTESTIVQCNNQVYLFRGVDETPLYWTGDWSTNFELAPTPTPAGGFSIVPNSNQATFYQNRLWVKDGKDAVAASDVLDFTAFDDLANNFNLNTGSSDYLITTFPFGTATLVVFKNKSILALTSVDGSLADVNATEITRQVGIIGINAVVSVGPDAVYMSDRNINLLSLTSTNNALQHKTLPLSRNIKKIISRVNWNAASKVSMAYFDNKLYVSLPLDNATSCNSVVVYNFVTEQWYGEWSFATSIGIAIQGWVVATYQGEARLHCVTEDGRIFVADEGQNDISGATVAEIATSLTTRAYRMDNANRINRRMWADLGTNRPSFSVTAYADGASESEEILSDQTYLRSASWIFNDSTYTLTNANDDYNRAFRKDYSTGPDSVQCGTGFQPEMLQDYRIPIITRRKGRLSWYKIDNTQGVIAVRGIGTEGRSGDRGNLVQVG